MKRGRWLLAAGLALLVLVGVPAAGVMTSMGQSFVAAPPAAAAPTLHASNPGRLSVAVVIGATGTVAADALIPFEVFARSDRFWVYTVAASPAAAVLSGGVSVVPDATFAEPLPRPDVVVVPAVAGPASELEAPLRDWVAAQHARGARLLGVCAGAELLALSGLLDGKAATSHWAEVDRLRGAHPRVRWHAGVRFVNDDHVLTTAGVTSATAGALHLVELLAGAGEAERIGANLAYPGWSRTGDRSIPVHRWTAGDLPFMLNAAFPWFRPTVALAVADGVPEIDVAAAAEVFNGGSFAASTVVVGMTSTVLTRHGMRLAVRPIGTTARRLDRVQILGGTAGADIAAIEAWARERGLTAEGQGRDAAGRIGFGSALQDLARHADRGTAIAAAAYLEYPVGPLAGSAWPWRPTALAGATLLSAVVMWAATHLAGRGGRNHDNRHGRPVIGQRRPMTSRTAGTANCSEGWYS